MPVEKDYIGGLHGYLKENFGDDFKLTTEQFKSKLSTDSAYANQLHGYLKENFGEGFKLDIADFQNKVGYIDPSKKKQNSSPNFATTLQEAITPLPSGVQKPLESSSPLASNLKSVATEKPIDAKTALLQKANQEQNLSNPLEGTTQTDVFIEENRKPTVLNMAKSINNKSQERVKVLTERVGLLKGIKDFEAQIPKIQESAQQLSDIVKDPTQPITSRQAAQEQLKLYQDQFDQFENAVNNYKGLIDKEKSIITDIHKDEDLRQKGLERDYNSITAFVDAIKSSTIKVGAGGAGMFNTLGLSGDPEDTNSENNEQVQNEVRNNVQTIKKFGESLVTQETPKNFEKIFEGDFSTKKLKYILAQGIGQTIPTVAAGFLGGAGGATIAGAGLGFIESKDMFKAAGLNEKQSDWAAFGLAIPLGALDEYGISDIITKPIGKLILKETTEDVIKTLAKKELTNEAIFETVKKTLGEKIKEYSIDVAKAGWKEPLTEMEQALLSEGAKQATEEITGKDSNANQTLSEYFKQTALKIAEEGVYGLAGGVGLSAVTSAIQNRTTPSAYQRAMELKNPELLQDFTEQLDSEVQSGRLTTEQAQIALENVKKIQELDGKIPNTIKDIDKRSMAASLVGVKDELKLEIEGKDETLVQPLKDEIKNIDQTLLDIAQNKPIEEIENGLNEQETSMSEIPTNQEQKIETPQETKTTTTPSSDNSSEVAALGSVEVPKTLSQLKISDEITQTLENKLKGLESERTNKLIENKGKGKFDDRLKDEIEEVKRNIYKRENELASRRNSDLESKIKDGSLLKLISENKITAEDARGLIIESGMEIPSEIQSIVDKNKQDKKENKQSIIERDTDFLGNEKEAYMVNNDKANGIRTQEDIDYYKANVKRAIESGKYEKSVKEGRMTANDARIIVESYGLKVPKTLETLLKTEQTNEPTPIEATIPTSNKGTQTAEPTKQDGEAKVESKPIALPKENDVVTLEVPNRLPIKMAFKDGVWKQKIGNEFTEVAKSVQDNAQAKFDEQNKTQLENGINKTESKESKPITIQRGKEADKEGANANARNEAKREEIKSAFKKLRDEGLLKTADKTLIGKAKRVLGIKSAPMSDAEIDVQMALIDAMADVWKKTTGKDNFYETFIADVKKGNLAELQKIGGVLFQDTENTKRPTTRVTLAVFDATQFEKMKGQQVAPQAISDLVKGRGKQIEKDIINMVLGYDKYKGQKRISFDEFRSDVETQIMKLEKIRTDSYANYGYDNLGDNENYGERETVIFNSPIEHGEKGHFSGDFTTEGLDKTEWELKQIPNTDKWAAMDKNMPSNVTADNVAEYVGTAGEKAEVEKWIADRDKESIGGLNKGLFGHIRKWFNKSDGIFHIAELQSDYYQKNKASDLLKPEVGQDEIDAYMNKNVWQPMDREISRKIKEQFGITVKKFDDKFIAYDKEGRPLSEVELKEEPLVGLNVGDFEENAVVVYALKSLSERRVNDEKLENGTYKGTLNTSKDGGKIDTVILNTEKEVEDFAKANDGRLNGSEDSYNVIRENYHEERKKLRQTEEQKFIQKRQAELEKTKPTNIQLKQFVASQKVHELRLLREAIKMAADEGAETVRFPDQYTLAVIEGYTDATGQGNTPYEVVNGDSDRLYEGDMIDYGGENMTVVEQNRDTITVVPSDEVSIYNLYDLINDETDDRVREIEYEAKRHFGDMEAITKEDVESYEPDEWMGAEAKSLLEEYFEQNEEEETVSWKEIKNGLYDSINSNYSEMSVDDILGWSGTVWQDGDTIYAIEGRNYETFNQPDGYEESSTKEDYYDNLSSDQKTVVDKYGELGKQFEKMRPDARLIQDENGMGWYETTITEEDKNNPIVAFQEEGGKVKGAIDFTNNNKATLYVFDGADISTLAHEMSGHLGRRVLEKLAEASPEFAKKYEAVKKWAGVKDVWTTKAEEKFARGFERYLRDGVAPTKALKEVFSKLKEWLSGIYKIIKGSSIDVKLTNDVRNVFDSLLGKEQVEQKPTTAEKVAKAEKSINDIRNKLKEKFKVNLPEGTQTKGFTMNELIDVIADTAIQIAKTGIEINEAIKQAIQYLKEEGDLEDFDETEIFDKAKEAVSTTESAIVKDPILKRINKAFLKIGTEILDNAEALMAKAASIVGDVRKNVTAGFETRDGKPIGFTYDTDQVARERFDFSKLKQIGKGSDRTVFDLGNGRVLKVAHTARGLEQNIYEGDYLLKGIIPEVFERGLNYVVVENTPRLKAADKVITYDYETGEENGTTTAGDMLRQLGQFNQSHFEKHNDNLLRILGKFGFSDIMSYDVLFGDFTAIRNWGYKDGMAVHLDGGTFGGVRMLTNHKNKAPLSDPEFREIYNKSKQLKKQFGDTDKNTRFNITMPNGSQVTVKPFESNSEDKNNALIRENNIEGKLLNKQESESLQKEIESKYQIEGQPKFGQENEDIRTNLFNYENPIAEKDVNGVNLRIAEGLIEGEKFSGNRKKTFLLYADGKIVGKFYSVEDAKKVVKFIEQNLINQKTLLPQGQPLFQLNDKGEILGFTHNGKIYLNGEKITANTTMEEAGHIWINWAKENRSDLYKQGIEKVLGSKYLIEVNNNPNYQAEALKAGEKGSEAYNAYMQEEALAKAIADNGAKFITETRKANFREWVTAMWKEVVKAFGIQNLSPNQVKKLTLEQFAKMAAADVFKKESVMTDKEKATAKVEILDADQKMLVDDITIAENDEETIQGVKGFIDSMNRAKGLTQEEKDAMNERLGRNYEVLSNEKLELIGKTIIEELGGLDKALLEAQNAKSDLLPYMKTFILGQAILENKKLEQNAATQEAKNKYADIQIDLFDKLDNLSRDFGRAIQYLNKLYSKSALAVTRKAKKILADRNGANQIEAEQAADKIEAAIFEDDNTDSANEALQDLLNNEKEKVKELEAAYEKLKKQIANPTEPRPNNPKRDLGSSKDKKATIKRLKETKYNANRQNIIPIAPPKLMEDLNDLTLEYMEEGFYDFEDIQKKLKKDLGGLHSDYYAEAYEQSKEKAVSKGVKESEFTPTEQVNTILDKQRETSDAAKLAKASERLAKAQIEKVKQALSTDANKKSFKERLKNLIPKSGNIWLKYQESNVNSLVAKLNATASKNESPLLAEFSKLVTQNINEKLNELMPKGNNVSQEKNKSLELADIIKNEEKFAEIYEKALTKIKEQNKDNPKAISLLENLLEQNDLGKPFSKKAISNAIEQKIKQTKQSIDDVIIEGEESILAFKQKIVDSILKDAELDTEVEAEIKDRIEFEVDNLFNTQAKNHYKTTAQRIVNDAKSMADLPTTKKEAKVISQLISKVASMAKDTMINKKQVVGKTPLELMEFALKNAEIGRKIFTEAQKEVQDIIKNDENLTAQEKADLKQFLENYQKSIFDALLTNKNKDLIIKEALVKLGYATQDSKGNIVADLGKIALSKNTPKEAIEKVKEAISNELGLDPSEIDDLLAALETRFNELIQAKKEAKINAVVKANDRYKAATQFSNKARKDKIRSLIELYNAGGLTNDKILEKMARDLGIIAFTDNDQKIIEDLLQRIDNAGLGFVSAGLEEELQAYFEHIGGTFAMKEMFERWRARLLSGFITTGKNLTGFFDTGFMIGHQLIDSNMNMGLLKGNVDLNILKVIRQANRIGGTLALESLVNGSVDNGSAFAEQTGQKEGTPSVRFLEFQKYHNYWTPDLPVTVKGVTFNLNPINALKKNEKYVQRVLGATDSVNHTILQEMKSYTFIKRVVMRGSPEMSAKEAAKVAYEIMYYLDITEATIAASEMYKEQGLDIDKNKRAFNKLVYKLAQDHTLFRALRKATDEFKKSNIEYTSKSGKLKLNRRINEIAQQTRADDVIKAATEFASRYTYKQSDMGVFPLVANLIKYVKDVFPLMAARIRKNAKGTAYSKQANKIANGIEISGELLFTSTMPFINGVANILEKGLEFNPIYGGIKSATYLGLALNANNKKDTTKARELSAKSGEVIYRVAVGMLLMALLQSLADDDEADDEKAIYGQGDKNFNRNKVIETVRPQNTIRIGGRDISFDFFGTLATEIKIQSIAMDLKRYADKEITNTQYMGMVYNQIISSSFTKGLSDIATAASSTAQTGKLATYFEKKTAELSTRVVLPFTSFARQAGQVAEPEAKKAIGLKENIIKQAGVGGWLLNRPNLDYRGRTYDTGELYTSSASGAMNLFGSRVNKDPIDIWVLKAANNNLGVSDIKKDSDKFYLVDNPDGTSRPMTDEETYDVSAEAARIFNGLLVDYYNKEKNNPITKTSQEQVAKDLSERHNEAKKASFRKLFKGSKNEDKYLEDKFDWLKKDEGKETEIKRAADDIANKVSEETKALRDRLPKDKYDKQIFLAKMLRSIVNKTTTLKQWKEAGIIESVEKEGQEILKLSK